MIAWIRNSRLLRFAGLMLLTLLATNDFGVSFATAPPPSPSPFPVLIVNETDLWSVILDWLVKLIPLLLAVLSGWFAWRADRRADRAEERERAADERAREAAALALTERAAGLRQAYAERLLRYALNLRLLNYLSEETELEQRLTAEDLRVDAPSTAARELFEWIEQLFGGIDPTYHNAENSTNGSRDARRLAYNAVRERVAQWVQTGDVGDDVYPRFPPPVPIPEA